MGLTAALLVGALLGSAESRGPSDHRIPATVISEATAPSSGANPAIPLDKLLHASVSANLVLGAAAIAHWAGLPDWAAVAIGAGVSLSLGVIRELVGNRDPWDLAANGVGITAGVITTSILLGGTF